MAKFKVMEARVLGAIEEMGVRCGHFIQAAPEHIMSLVRAGLVDAHPEAVAYAKDAGEVLQRVGGALGLVDEDVQVVTTSDAVLAVVRDPVDAGPDPVPEVTAPAA